MSTEQSGHRAAHRVRRAVLALTVSVATAAAVGVALVAPGSGSATAATAAPADLRIAGAWLGGLVPAIPPTPRATPDAVSAPSPSPAALEADAAPPAAP